jgi:putative resolvase
MISISEAGKILGVTTRTLKRWDETNVLPTYRTLGNHRRYKQSDVEAFMGLKRFQEGSCKNVFIYTRVSTKKQAESGNLQRQKERLLEYCNANKYHISHIYEEIASGMNDERRELLKMFRSLSEVDTIVIEYEDRLARFGYTYLMEFAKSRGVSIEVVDSQIKSEPNEEMVKDLVSIVTSFSARLYGARGGKKVKNTLEALERERQVERYENDDKSNTI